MIKYAFDWSEASTRRNTVWALVGLLGIFGWLSGKDLGPLIYLGASVAGGLGMFSKDGQVTSDKESAE